ncbi:hypothetical protein BGZ76_010699 [Entomortierella beljakovae]|nr:hypothetical protein BGZ76_010699 [Entomortierella beljakovae]
MESDQASYLSNIRVVFDLALQAAPSAIVIQDLDLIAKNRGIDSTLLSSTISIISREMARARDANNVFIFGVSNNRAKLPDVFSKQNIFSHEYQISIPLKAQRQEILEALAKNFKKPEASNEPVVNHTVSQISQMTSGFVVKDLLNLCRSSLLHKLRTNEPDTKVDVAHSVYANIGFPSWSDFSNVIRSYKPSQQIEFESITRSSDLEKYGGYAKLKKQVYQTIHWPLTNPETFKRMGVKPPMGLLLYGPSGCGKTLLIHTLASELSMNFIPIKSPEIFSKYLGETEATLRRLFAMARQIAPCILFFDEMDSIGAKRGWGGDSHSNGVNERVLSTLLNEMDGVEERTNVFVVGCTNQPQAIDDALLRPGRLDQLIYIGYPGFQDRTDIIHTIGQRIPLPSDSESIDQIARATVGFSPADLSGLFREAAITSLRSDIDSNVVELDYIQQVVKRLAPSVQSRINLSKIDEPNRSDVLIPDQYRRFQQDR